MAPRIGFEYIGASTKLPFADVRAMSAIEVPAQAVDAGPPPIRSRAARDNHHTPEYFAERNAILDFALMFPLCGRPLSPKRPAGHAMKPRHISRLLRGAGGDLVLLTDHPAQRDVAVGAVGTGGK